MIKRRDLQTLFSKTLRKIVDKSDITNEKEMAIMLALLSEFILTVLKAVIGEEHGEKILKEVLKNVLEGNVDVKASVIKTRVSVEETTDKPTMQ